MRIGPLVQIIFFLAFLLSGAVLMLAYGGHETVSEAENRRLAPVPEWSLEALQSGDYFRLWENYTADHIAFRDALVAASKRISSWQAYTGREEAELTFRGVTSRLRAGAGTLVCDVGGGSTELILGGREGVSDAVSLARFGPCTV